MSNFKQHDLWGIPFDGEASLGYPGSRYAPERVRSAARWINMRIQDGKIYCLETDSFHDVGEGLLVDRGDVQVSNDTQKTFAEAEKAVRKSLSGKRVPIMIGGDDSLLFPVAKGIHDELPGSLAIVHFDAHLDLLDQSVAQGRFSQSSGMRRALELQRVDAKRSIQLCERHFNFPTSGRFKQEIGLTHLSARQVIRMGPEATVAAVLKRIEGADNVFLAFDIDAIDPAFAPGAGAHEPGGITSADALEMVALLAPHCVGMCINEVNPAVDVGDMTSTLAAYLAFTFAVYGSRRER
jgi:agmatinase